MNKTDLAKQHLTQQITTKDPVPCNGCQACCKGYSVVELRPHWGDKLELYEQKNHVEGTWILKLKPNGDCVYLTDKGCGIYNSRPAVCRNFDCRREFASYNRQQRKRAIASNLFGEDIFAEGKKRVHTMTWQPEEQGGKIYTDIAEFQLGVAEEIVKERKRLMGKK